MNYMTSERRVDEHNMQIVDDITPPWTKAYGELG